MKVDNERNSYQEQSEMLEANIRLLELLEELPALEAELKYAKKVFYLQPIIVVFSIIPYFLVLAVVFNFIASGHYLLTGFTIIGSIVFLVTYEIKPKDSDLGKYARLDREDLKNNVYRIVHRLNYTYNMCRLFSQGKLTEESFYNPEYWLLKRGIKVKKYKLTKEFEDSMLK